MQEKEYHFSGKRVAYYLGASISWLDQLSDPAKTILLVDDQVAKLHGDKLAGWKKIVIPGQESSKDIGVFQEVVNQLIAFEADRKTVLVGVGGGVVTDLTGFVASVYLRGIAYGFVPTTLLSQVDAAIGGKNGINFSLYKNVIGVIRQPDFLLFDQDLLQTLPLQERYNGFAEIIKYACIADEALFNFLENRASDALAFNPEVIGFLVERSAEIKSEIVAEDEFENGQRRLLNFGHTVGHAVEKLEKISHGQAVAKGMAFAADLSCRLSGMPVEDRERIVRLIDRYHLPVKINSEADDIARYFTMDKKRENNDIHFILLNKIGDARVKPVPLNDLSAMLKKWTIEKV